jgi:hypothetical protein
MSDEDEVKAEITQEIIDFIYTSLFTAPDYSSFNETNGVALGYIEKFQNNEQLSEDQQVTVLKCYDNLLEYHTSGKARSDLANDPNKLDLAEVLAGLFESIGNKILDGKASDDERNFFIANEEMYSSIIEWLSGKRHFSSQDREDVMEVWVVAKEQMLI